MIKEVWDSFKDNVKERVTNPFLGTFALVWIVHNWRIVYSFFNFDKEWKLQTKVDYFKKYWTEHNFILNLIFVALITIIVLIATYTFLAISRFLANYFENIIIPWIYRFSKGKTVTYEIYQKILNRVEVLEARVEEERKLKNQAISERDTIEGIYGKLLEEKESFEKTREEVRLEQEALIKEKNEFMEKREQFSMIRDEFLEDKAQFEAAKNKPYERSKNDYSEMIKRVKRLLSTGELQEIILDILKGYAFPSSNSSLDYLLKNGFIQLVSKNHEGSTFKFTEDGEEFKRQYFRDE